MLRLNGHSIINLREFKEYADFWQAYDQIDEFLDFAEIHCLPIQLLDGNGEPVKYLNKQFWIELLTYIHKKNQTMSSLLNIGGYQDYIINRCVRFYETEKRRRQILKATMRNIIPEDPGLWDSYVEQAIYELLDDYQGDFSSGEIDDIRKELEIPFSAGDEYITSVKAEADKLHISDILKTVQKNTNHDKDAAKVILVCTSMQLITELGIQKLNPHRKNTVRTIDRDNSADKKKPVLKAPQIPGNRITKPRLSIPIDINGTKAMRERTEFLPCRKEPYIWLLYEESTLEPGQYIQTVKVEAAQGESDSVIIQLFSEKRGAVIFEFRMKPGEYRHCNVTAHSVICFLPTMSICEQKCVYRPFYDKGDLCVQHRNGQAIDLLKYGEDVSCFAVSNEGDIYVRKGSVLLGRYAFAKRNRKIANKLETISFEEFVEVRLLADGFLLLTNMGIIRSNLSEWDGQRAVTLYAHNNIHQISEKSRSRYREYQIEGKNIVLHSEHNDQCSVLWESLNRFSKDAAGKWIINGGGDA